MSLSVQKLRFLSKLALRRYGSLGVGVGVGTAVGLSKKTTHSDFGNSSRPATTSEKVKAGVTAGVLGAYGHAVLSAAPGAARKAWRGRRQFLSKLSKNNRIGPVITKIVGENGSPIPDRSPMWLQHTMHPFQSLRAKRMLKFRDKRYRDEFRKGGIIL